MHLVIRPDVIISVNSLAHNKSLTHKNSLENNNYFIRSTFSSTAGNICLILILSGHCSSDRLPRLYQRIATKTYI